MVNKKHASADAGLFGAQAQGRKLSSMPTVSPALSKCRSLLDYQLSNCEGPVLGHIEQKKQRVQCIIRYSAFDIHCSTRSGSSCIPNFEVRSLFLLKMACNLMYKCVKLNIFNRHGRDSRPHCSILALTYLALRFCFCFFRTWIIEEDLV